MNPQITINERDLDNLHNIINDDDKYWELIKDQVNNKENIRLKTISHTITIASGVLALMVSFGDSNSTSKCLFDLSMIMCCICILSGFMCLCREISLCNKAIKAIEDKEIMRAISLYFNQPSLNKQDEKIIKIPKGGFYILCYYLCWMSFASSIAILTYLLIK